MRCRFTSLCVLCLLCLLPLRAQTLAHPGWRGNGIASQAWWSRASFVRLGADTTFANAARDLDLMAEAGLDSMILPDLQPAADGHLPFNERFGSEDDLDALLREASARRVHVLVGIPVTRLSVGGGEVRFWMTRGIAGVDVGNVSPGDLSVLRGVRSAMARFPGERILIAHTAAASTAASQDRRDPVELHTVSASEAGVTKPNPQYWQAVEITTWDDHMPMGQGRVALVFDSKLLETPGGPAKAHAMVVERSRRRPR